MNGRRGFTFLELVLVAMTVGVLMAIAIPNFLEAQTRARVSRERTDLTMIAIAVEAYRTNHGDYPRNQEARRPQPGDLVALTTPIAFLVRIPTFSEDGRTDGALFPRYVNLAQFHSEDQPFSPPYIGGAALYSVSAPGPDRDWDLKADADPVHYLPYDPTNGTVSSGDHDVFGP